MMTTTTANIPTDTDAYARWLANKMRALAARHRSLGDIDAEHRHILDEAARELIDAVQSA